MQDEENGTGALGRYSRETGIGQRRAVIAVDDGGKPLEIGLRTDKAVGLPMDDVIEGANEETLTEPVLKRLAEIDRTLDARDGKLDPATGREGYAIERGSQKWRVLEIERVHLRERVLPYQRMLGQRSDAARAEQQSTLAEAKERQERVRARAVEMAEEQEAAELARKILADRKRQAGG